MAQDGSVTHNGAGDEERANPASAPSERDDKGFSWDDHFHGAVTVGERGQVVIPASARKRFQIEPGDKLLIMSDPAKRTLMLCKIDALREFMNAFQAGLERAERAGEAREEADTEKSEETEP